ncbi:3-hydroxyacyl-CoA dehydrogenase [Mesorhizobium sp. M7A.F.Ca.US.006.01.1.1]|uniref:3-hydroxyacyl-CoA dehydrogenase NAD-binding domain-containing protein n=1 Tax=Mesorhizobium sp. M7A.F.Ca.US.006.01.1.1 TaxID=2496707 RepID=UPI000FC9A7A5|nr:3-hydroxyacyl-CoA dehydrogenase NAD-binding domain-containing protein [Mesorhizobium sp. M7A.F.Ca.US.006.01.1.1]RUZ73499.1 3-hydroxyacyl-CoA dehydrogenase [Mesorhizobium sp. M7A.F.Ca.US.006.01.1.1]
MVVTIERADDVAIIWLNSPPVNALNHALRTELAAALEGAEKDAAVVATVLASRLDSFSAGADIKEFNQPPSSPTLREIIEQIDTATKPVVVAIGGIAFGGGFEIALACDARVVTEGASLALPEVKIGLLPGAGGTQRLPRLIEPAKALKFISDGNPVKGRQVLDDDIADELVSKENLIVAAVAKAREIVSSQVRRRLSDVRVQAGTRQAFEVAAAAILKTQFDNPQMEAIVSAIRDAYEHPFETGMRKEREYFDRLKVDDRSKALRHAFFAERSSGRTPSGGVARICSVGVIGGGTMGAGIAMAFASCGVPVVLIETDEAAAKRAIERIGANYAHSVKRSSISEAVKTENLGRITAAVDYSSLRDVDLVIEAAFEEMDIKRQIFGKLVEVTKPTAILATNTSYLSVDEIAAASGVPERVLGMHFFSPANIMKLVEVVHGTHTRAEVIDAVVTTAHRLGKIPVVVGDCHGFVGNRMLARRSEQVDRLLLEGASPEHVDLALTNFGSKLGPCAMGDLAGLDISWRMRRATGRRAPVADALVEAGRHGQKTRKGYYRYGEDGRTPISDPEVTALIEAVSKREGVERRSIDRDEIIDRLILPMVNEGARILNEGIAARSGDIDVIWMHGYGFPRWRGGPMFYAQTRGLPAVATRLKELAAATGDNSLQPAPLLQELAATGANFS